MMGGNWKGFGARALVRSWVQRLRLSDKSESTLQSYCRALRDAQADIDADADADSLTTKELIEFLSRRNRNRPKCGGFARELWSEDRKAKPISRTGNS